MPVALEISAIIPSDFPTCTHLHNQKALWRLPCQDEEIHQAVITKYHLSLPSGQSLIGSTLQRSTFCHVLESFLIYDPRWIWYA